MSQKTFFDCTARQWVGIITAIISLSFLFGAAFSNQENLVKRQDNFENRLGKLEDMTINDISELKTEVSSIKTKVDMTYDIVKNYNIIRKK